MKTRIINSFDVTTAALPPSTAADTKSPLYCQFERIASLADVRPALSEAFNAPVDYLISGHWAQQKLYLAAGDQQ